MRNDDKLVGPVGFVAGATKVGVCGGVCTPPIIENFPLQPAEKIKFLKIL
jgi:hypothetical protein